MEIKTVGVEFKRIVTETAVVYFQVSKDSGIEGIVGIAKDYLYVTLDENIPWKAVDTDYKRPVVLGE